MQNPPPWLPFVGAALLTVAAAAQAPNEFDFDTTQLAVTTIPPNGATHVITTPVTYTGQNLRLDAPLTVAAGGELRLVRSVLRVFGNVVLQEGGRITVIDSDLLLPCAYQRQYDIRTEGGLLHTERARIGSGHVGSNLFLTRFLHLRGTWLARQTVVQGVALMIADGRNGWYGNPLQKGGSLFGVGVYEGDRADAIHLSGMGDVQLTDGTMNIALYYDAGSQSGPTTAVLDLDSRQPLTRTYGDPTVHAGVTNPIANNPYRLALANHRSPMWQLFAVNASSALPLQTLVLQHAEDVICSFRGTNLAGSPVLGGPWASYYATLPGLPSTTKPGHHALPPGCSVQLANVRYQSGTGAADWNRIRSWGVYSNGAGTNLTISGPTHLAELNLTSGVVNLQGTGTFDMGLFANTIRLFQGATLTIDNAALSDFQTGSGQVGLIEANDNSVCTVTNSRTAAIRFRTTNPAASITAQNLFGVQNVVVDTAGGGSVQITQATPTGAWDLQNLGFDAALLAGGLPPHWAPQSVTGSLAAAAPGAPGGSSFQLQAQAAGASLQKQLSLPAGSHVSLLAAARILTAPGGSAALRWSTAQGATSRIDALGLGTLNTWQRVHVPTLVTSGTGTTSFAFAATGLPATVQLDDVRIVLGSWWETDNLGNLDFEGECRDQGLAPNFWAAPDCWTSYQADCAPDASVVRPGALANSRSLRLLPTHALGNITKVLTFFRAGESVRVRGWVRGTATSGASIQVIVGNGPNYFAVQAPNVFTGPIPCDGSWHQVDITYVVPANPSYTRMDVSAFGMAGNPVWFDDLTVEVQP